MLTRIGILTTIQSGIKPPRYKKRGGQVARLF